ncbi:hypothetical protein EW093_16720 [Thiospirochaeta perfilievii]|uniref:Protein CR006 P-loop domain-containing protein n=1 Tax=Thiospirochaeta perfilievii TaxID=252967 RepID=A0A5C1QIW2_9SPIO|nr:hypothetical protein EW093_16720 [Thiospirochaeta perfilievii]
MKKEYEELYEKYELVEQEINEKLGRIEELKSQTKDEKKGADQVNKYLNNYFGHNSLKLEHEEGEGNYRFVIKRGDHVAYNLSEGESSLISFCYFMAKLEEIETKDKKLIIWIDDVDSRFKIA